MCFNERLSLSSETLSTMVASYLAGSIKVLGSSYLFWTLKVYYLLKQSVNHSFRNCNEHIIYMLW